jgi:hypothetical protein
VLGRLPWRLKWGRGFCHSELVAMDGETPSRPPDPPDEWDDPGKELEEGDTGSWLDPGKEETKGNDRPGETLEDVLREHRERRTD